MKRHVLIFLFAGLGLSGCRKEEDLPQPSTLLDTQWVLTQLDGTAVKTVGKASAPTLLELSSISNTNAGQAPCNRYTGNYQLTARESQVRFTRQASTNMACAQGELEATYLQTLPQIARYELRNNELRLYDATQATPRLVFREKL